MARDRFLGTKYTLYVDESGEAGIEKVRGDGQRGASPYMVLGGVLVPVRSEDKLSSRLCEIADKFGKSDLHCQKLSHFQTAYYARQVSGEKVLCFGVVSLKETLGDYKQEIGADSKLYYNKCAQYLLEKVGRFMCNFDIDPSDVTVVFEEANCNYSALRKLISRCRENPIQPESKFLKRIEPFSISAEPKSNKPMLQLADLTAHSLYQCVNKSDHNYQLPETRYLRELQGRFYSAPNSRKVVGYGIKAVHSVTKLKLDKEVRDFFNQLQGAVIKTA